MKVKNNGMNCNFAVVILMSMFMLVLGCDKDTDINSAVRRTGRAVGSGATRFFNGVGEGIDAASAAIKEEKDGVVFVVCEITARDGCRDKLLAELDKIVPVVRREKGCISYTPLVDIASGIENQSPQRVNTVTLVECWESETALKAHLAQDHMVAYSIVVKNLCENTVLHVTRAASK